MIYLIDGEWPTGYGKLIAAAQEAGARYARSYSDSLIKADIANVKELADIWFTDEILQDVDERDQAIRLKQYPLPPPTMKRLYRMFAESYSRANQ